MQDSYEAPTISTLGTVRELTLQANGVIDKCGGQGDLGFPALLSNRFADDCNL